MTSPATEQKITKAEATLPAKKWYASTELWAAAGLVISGAIGVLAVLGIDLPFTGEQAVEALKQIGSFVATAGGAYMAYKRLKDPVRLPIEGTKAADGG